MSRSGLSEDCDEQWMEALWRGRVRSATRGKRGQKFYRELLAALDAMPKKELHAEVFDESSDGSVCALGVLCRVKGIDVIDADPEDDSVAEELAIKLDVADCLTRTVIWENDNGGPLARPIFSEPEDRDEHGYWLHGNRRVIAYVMETPDQRWHRMRDWVAKRINF